MKRRLIITLLACAAACANAQTVYRCGSTYSERPCSEGTPVQGLNTPDAGDVAAARKEHERQAQAAEAMEKARLKEEAKPVPAYIPKEKVEETPKPRQPEVFVARVPGEKKKVAKRTKRKKSPKNA